MLGWENFKLWSYFSHESNFLREKCSPSSHLNFKKSIQGCSFLHQLNLVLTVKSVSHVPPWGFFTITQLFQSFVDLFSTLWNMFPAERQHNFLFSAFNMSTFYFKSSCKIKSLVMIRRSVLEGCCSFWKAALQLCSHVLRSYQKCSFGTLSNLKTYSEGDLEVGFEHVRAYLEILRDGSESAAASFTHSFH